MTEITRDAIIAAYGQTEIVPVARTWDTRAVLWDLDGTHPREVACGCALVALCRAAGIDPEGLSGAALIAAVGLPVGVGSAIVLGWDDWPAHSSTSAWGGSDAVAARAAYLAAWEAAAVVLGGRRTSRADAELPADPHEAQGDADANA